jgi:hypothetical protein
MGAMIFESLIRIIRRTGLKTPGRSRIIHRVGTDESRLDKTGAVVAPGTVN